jgi:hypothetical protein
VPWFDGASPRERRGRRQGGRAATGHQATQSRPGSHLRSPKLYRLDSNQDFSCAMVRRSEPLRAERAPAGRSRSDWPSGHPIQAGPLESEGRHSTFDTLDSKPATPYHQFRARPCDPTPQFRPILADPVNPAWGLGSLLGQSDRPVCIR